MKGIFRTWKVFLDDIRMIRVYPLKRDLVDGLGVFVCAGLAFYFIADQEPEVIDKLDLDNLFGGDWYVRVERGKEVLEARLSTKDT
ncbi:MAG: hypothetical protein OXH52_14095 [Gammaproteobacteria bacterium]|nr:hypothetical protein [Gammaproteobacteria bacterium]